ncbi:Helix-turn-helix motif,Homeobox domain, metazoa,Homeobox domain,Homeobox domain-like,Homeobox [Cinara cedri]|uniref:Helix-turn-helix motif,Homeobox domain, metazoa,Homeobox domain,Homeobox domain-like,Homeobox n=1 Tax=Cinara cedri TaxID=506608 RepID=A0A5E4N933_9HEMI|nr:Helix-turn-helix motif,Homeobox domain, metazoa,Homeobox domain,Homeobox domain-like,Homeobox [Cinara cedri]
MDDQRSQSSCHHATDVLNFGIDQILKSDNESDRQPKEKGKCAGRAVFTIAQKNWLEYYFQMEKYITKPNRKALASALGLTDLQVKVWFQNRRMKWRHATSSNA